MPEAESLHQLETQLQGLYEQSTVLRNHGMQLHTRFIEQIRAQDNASHAEAMALHQEGLVVHGAYMEVHEAYMRLYAELERRRGHPSV